MTTFYLGSSVCADYRIVEVKTLRRAKREASMFYGIAGCGYLTVSVLTCNQTTKTTKFVELARKWGFCRWESSM